MQNFGFDVLELWEFRAGEFNSLSLRDAMLIKGWTIARLFTGI